MRAHRNKHNINLRHKVILKCNKLYTKSKHCHFMYRFNCKIITWYNIDTNKKTLHAPWDWVNRPLTSQLTTVQSGYSLREAWKDWMRTGHQRAQERSTKSLINQSYGITSINMCLTLLWSTLQQQQAREKMKNMKCNLKWPPSPAIQDWRGRS